MPSMHYAFINRYKVNKNGGAENWIKEISQILISKGHKVDIIAPKDKEILNYEMVGVREVEYSSKIYNLFKRIGILNFGFVLVAPNIKIDLKKYDVVYVTSFLQLFIFTRTKGKFIIGTHDFFLSNNKFTVDFPIKIIKYFLYFLCKNRRVYVHSLSTEVSNSLLPGCMKIVEVGNNGLYKYTPDPADDDFFNILFLGKVDKRKGAKLLIELLKNLPDLKSVRLWVVGEIELDYREILESVRSNHIILTGFINESEKRNILAKASCFLFFSNRDVFPLTATEALRYGLPIISTWRPLIGIHSDELIFECSSTTESVLNRIELLKREWDENKEDYFQRKVKRARQFYEKNKRIDYEKAILNLFEN